MAGDEDGTEGIRINKFLSEAGTASRRGSDKIIEDGRVTINGRTAVLGDKVFDDDKVCVDGKEVKRVLEDIILAFYKPMGVTSTSDRNDENNVIDYLGYPKRIFSIGRLDKDSEGLLLMTNNGDLANRIMRSKNEHEKEYLVKVNKNLTAEFIQKMSNGVLLDDGKVTKKCFVESEGPREFRIILKQGLNRQIRRMCEQLGYEVKNLKRMRVVNITLGDLKEGRYRDISKKEREELYRQLGLK
ncbi:23S rRNA pseudouridine synthase F [Candidatus Methanoplasma termitum]|uniref:23S rRNA pseudouridine synthase F n=1 Tax=Candidatus Methanoplasma termitum TaxID=1577791 RepID=A0A0A7LGA3_9ARCH|nr:pseudouridine synthase [Candidatus Methanoplasma termitum]AIZ56526.1 23S rRNA pseudouridine synthase F [Candidatus Methanoplasma termitum]MCL2333393.1 pseudouridine synthase [Candidatus Methanoplasma sp.]